MSTGRGQPRQWRRERRERNTPAALRPNKLLLVACVSSARRPLCAKEWSWIIVEGAGCHMHPFVTRSLNRIFRPYRSSLPPLCPANWCQTCMTDRSSTDHCKSVYGPNTHSNRLHSHRSRKCGAFRERFNNAVLYSLSGRFWRQIRKL